VGRARALEGRPEHWKAEVFAAVRGLALGCTVGPLRKRLGE